MPAPSKAVLITGCSSGIGAATARRLAAEGYTVYATARRPQTLAELERGGCRTLALDVTDEASMRAAVDEVTRVEGAVGVLVNNAGYSQSGAIESISMEDVRRQFETNVFGLIRMCQLVLPGMRAQRWGKIVNVGSMGGRLTFPGGGLYHATKYAVEALSDALRFEVRGFGVDVILVEPGLIMTNFGQVAASSVAAGAVAAGGVAAGSVAAGGVAAGGVAAGGLGPGGEDGPYAEFNRRVAEITADAYRGPMARLGAGPDAVAGVIARAARARRPRARYPVTASARLMIGQRRITPDRLWDRLMRVQFPQPRP